MNFTFKCLYNYSLNDDSMLLYNKIILKSKMGEKLSPHIAESGSKAVEYYDGQVSINIQC